MSSSRLDQKASKEEKGFSAQDEFNSLTNSDRQELLSFMKLKAGVIMLNSIVYPNTPSTAPFSIQHPRQPPQLPDLEHWRPIREMFNPVQIPENTFCDLGGFTCRKPNLLWGPQKDSIPPAESGLCPDCKTLRPWVVTWLLEMCEAEFYVDTCERCRAVQKGCGCHGGNKLAVGRHLEKLRATPLPKLKNKEKYCRGRDLLFGPEDTALDILKELRWQRCGEVLEEGGTRCKSCEEASVWKEMTKPEFNELRRQAWKERDQLQRLGRLLHALCFRREGLLNRMPRPQGREREVPLAVAERYWDGRQLEPGTALLGPDTEGHQIVAKYYYRCVNASFACIGGLDLWDVAGPCVTCAATRPQLIDLIYATSVRSSLHHLGQEIPLEVAQLIWETKDIHKEARVELERIPSTSPATGVSDCTNAGNIRPLVQKWQLYAGEAPEYGPRGVWFDHKSCGEKLPNKSICGECLSANVPAHKFLRKFGRPIERYLENRTLPALQAALRSCAERREAAKISAIRKQNAEIYNQHIRFLREKVSRLGEEYKNPQWLEENFPFMIVEDTQYW